ncbi:MAG: biotin--[acetyl-CoA-carboxylase] ligase [Planctomycetaceae bacterium]|nr:biotin--[acetyl-CoA-carboxylase] ligase [Planctomycetaceae bacterium]
MEFSSLDVDVIKTKLDTERIGKKILIYKSTASTNDIAREYASGGEKNDGLIVLSEHQTAGKGRRGNKWFDGKHKSILCSILIFENKITPDMMAIIAAVACAKAIDKCGRHQAKIKWPNDVFVNDKKLAGILIEKKAKYYIIGIGINCHQRPSDFPEELEQIATSVDIECGRVCDRNLLAKRLMFNFERFLRIAQENPDEIVEKWHKRSMLTGKRITVEHNGKQFTGACLGVEPAQGLILQLERGGVKMFEAAGTTIVK